MISANQIKRIISYLVTDPVQAFHNRIDKFHKEMEAIGAEDASDDFLPVGFSSMSSAPKDGTEIEILFQHRNYYYATDEDRCNWQQVCKAHWTDFNSGGWVWTGICGVAICWRAIR